MKQENKIKQTIAQPSGLTASIEISLETFDDKSAKQALVNKADMQRNFKKWRQNQMMDDMTNDKWWFTGAPIIFNDQGRLIDGQHRLSQMVKTGCFYPVVVIKGILDDAYLAIDCNTPKTTADYFKYLGVKNANTAAAASLILSRYEATSDGGSSLKSGSVIPRSTIEATYWNHEESIMRAIKETKTLNRFVGSSGVAIASNVLIEESFGHGFTVDMYKSMGTGVHDHASVRSLHECLRLDNNRPKKQYSTDARLLSILKTAQRAFYEMPIARLWPNKLEVTKPLTR